MCCDVLCCAVLCCAVLCYVVLCCALLCYALLCSAPQICVLEDGEVDGELLSAALEKLFRMGHLKKAVQIAVKLLETPSSSNTKTQPTVSLHTKKALRSQLDMIRFVLWLTEPVGEPVSLDNLTFATLPPLNPHRTFVCLCLCLRSLCVSLCVSLSSVSLFLSLLSLLSLRHNTAQHTTSQHSAFHLSYPCLLCVVL